MKLEILEKDKFYHIYNRGINGGSIFKTEDNMNYFLGLVQKYLANEITILSYCLLNNHYHFLVKLNCEGNIATQLFSNLFNAYAKAFNKQQNRTGSLFEKHFKRKNINTEEYLKNIILYIHHNPENHHIVNDFRVYQFSSYKSIIANDDSLVDIDQVISLFEDKENFIFIHKEPNNENLQGFENLAGEQQTYKKTLRKF